jgi:CAAX prenyl protease-like protein
VDAAMPRILPFALFMAFIALESLIRWLTGPAPSSETAISPTLLWLYPLRIAVVLSALLYLWPAYQELRNTLCSNVSEALLVLVVGILVYVAWVRMDWSWAMQGQPTGYNPFQAGTGAGIVLAAIRIFGAVVVVPVMEELFWRSFLIRYVVAGMLAGVAYNLILYKTRRLWPCILAHAITNLLLGIHVLLTGEWHWW